MVSGLLIVLKEPWGSTILPMYLNQNNILQEWMQKQKRELKSSIKPDILPKHIIHGTLLTKLFCLVR